MIIAGFTIYAYQIPLVRALTMKGLKTVDREGLFIRLTDDNDRHGWGEISPLPGFSSEQSNDIIEQSQKLKYHLTGTTLPDHLEELSGGFDRWLRPLDLSASVRFGIEMAVLNLLASSRNGMLVELLGDTSARTITINALLSGTNDQVTIKAAEYLKAGYGTFKLKVGRKNLDADIALTRRVRQIIGDRTVLRLDANRAWRLDEAVSFAAGTKNCAIDYIEEPLVDSQALADFHERTGILFALDESLRESKPEKIVIPDGAAALILKPTLLGGFETTMRYARRAQRDNLKAVVSSSFETPAGLHALTHLAAALNDSDTAHGLGTAGRLGDDISDIPFRVADGAVEIAPLKPFHFPLKPTYLRELSND
ncbi:MAG: o-succinylbenzoate synthase [Candidatus Zixiibacteriota bacterium]